jgi:hypothetical protein
MVIALYTVKKNFDLGNGGGEPNDMEIGQFRPRRRLFLRRLCSDRILAHSGIAFFNGVHLTF